MTLSTLRAALSAHEAKRPDHLAATHPNAPAYLRREWEAWCETKRHLQTQIGMAEAQERNVWTDTQTGAKTTPEPWRGGLQDMNKMSQSKAEQMRDYRARKAAGETMAPGRPRAAEPSPAAMQKRRERAKRPRCAHINERGQVCALHAVLGTAFCLRHQAA